MRGSDSHIATVVRIGWPSAASCRALANALKIFFGNGTLFYACAKSPHNSGGQIRWIVCQFPVGLPGRLPSRTIRFTCCVCLRSFTQDHASAVLDFLVLLSPDVDGDETLATGFDFTSMTVVAYIGCFDKAPPPNTRKHMNIRSGCTTW